MACRNCQGKDMFNIARLTSTEGEKCPTCGRTNGYTTNLPEREQKIEVVKTALTSTKISRRGQGLRQLIG